MVSRSKVQTVPCRSRRDVLNEYDGYYNLGQAILFLVCEEYGLVYQKYIRGQSTENIYLRQRRYMEDDFTAMLINCVLNDTPEGLMNNIERTVRRELKEGKRGRFTKLH